MRILYVADDLYPGFGGQARATEGHIAALAARGHAVTAVAGRERAETRPPAGVRVVRMPSTQLGNAQTRIAYPVLGTLAEEVARADVVHANTPALLTAAAAALARRRGVPVVIGVHTQLETSTLQLPRVARWLERSLLAWYGWLFSQADLLVAPTPFAAATSRAFSRVPVVVVSNGVDASAFAAPPAPAGDRAARGGGRALLYVGRLSPEKRPQDLLELMRHLPSDHHLTLAGTGPLAGELAAAAEGLGGRVRLAGYVDEEEKRALLGAADLFVMPSPAELQSIATLEAMAAGCPVVAFDHPSSAVPGLVAEAGAGIVVPPLDARAQASAVQSLLADRETLGAMRRNARAYAALHDVQRSADRLEELYAALIGGERAWAVATAVSSGEGSAR